MRKRSKPANEVIKNRVILIQLKTVFTVRTSMADENVGSDVPLSPDDTPADVKMMRKQPQSLGEKPADLLSEIRRKLELDSEEAIESFSTADVKMMSSKQPESLGEKPVDLLSEIRRKLEVDSEEAIESFSTADVKMMSSKQPESLGEKPVDLLSEIRRKLEVDSEEAFESLLELHKPQRYTSLSPSTSREAEDGSIRVSPTTGAAYTQTCQLCNKSFQQWHHLKRHLLSHTDLRPHTCGVCGKTFRLLNKLKRHEAIHSGVKPYTCSLCGVKVSRMEHLKRHLLTHSENKPYQCSICQYTARRADTIRNHTRQKHNGMGEVQQVGSDVEISHDDVVALAASGPEEETTTPDTSVKRKKKKRRMEKVTVHPGLDIKIDMDDLSSTSSSSVFPEFDAFMEPEKSGKKGEGKSGSVSDSFVAPNVSVDTSSNKDKLASDASNPVYPVGPPVEDPSSETSSSKEKFVYPEKVYPVGPPVEHRSIETSSNKEKLSCDASKPVCPAGPPVKHLSFVEQPSTGVSWQPLPHGHVTTIQPPQFMPVVPQKPVFQSAYSPHK